VKQKIIIYWPSKILNIGNAILVKTINNSFYGLLILSSLFFACSNTNEKKDQGPQTDSSLVKLSLDLKLKSATIILPSGSVEDTASIRGSSEIRYPLEYPNAVIKLVGNSVHLVYPLQWPSYVKLSWKDGNQRLFLSPGDTLKITEKDGSFLYEGNSAAINNYLRSKEKAFGIKDFITAKGMLTSTVPLLDSLGPMVDAISQKEIDFLHSYCKEFDLPTWYIDFEYNDIRYFGGCVKLMAPSYRAEMLNDEQHPSPHYYDFLESLPVDNPQAVLSVYYYEFLNQFTRHYYLTDSLKSREVREWLPIILENSFRFYDEKLEAPIRDYMFMYIISRAVTSNQPLEDAFIRKAINALDDTSHQAQMRNLQLKHAQNVLPQGSKAPGFILPNEQDKPVSLKEFEGQIVLISFWATWCKPCLKEIPYENQLVESLEGQNFALVSICMGSSKIAWQSSLEKNQLKAINLYADQKWQENINQQYGIIGLPHYTLIDANGRIIEYKTHRPSEDSLALKIAKALDLLQSNADP
jgi:peroxiredoxin